MLAIDTIVLHFRPHEFAILKPHEFTPNTNRINATEPRDMGKGRHMRATRNPTRQDTAQAGYLPYLTYFKGIRAGGVTTGLRVQFSAPKLVYGNNFDELTEQDMQKLQYRLFEALKYYGIRFFKGMSAIENAQVVAIHFAKNFPLTHYLTAHEVITEMQKCDVSLWRDVSQSDYVNNGHGFKMHSKYYELAVYDKIAEYHKGKRHQPVHDKDVQLQFTLFDDKQRLPEVVRMEARLNNTQVIKSTLKKAGYENTPLTLSRLCTREVSQAVLVQQFEELYKSYPRISEAEAPDLHSLFSELYVQNPGRKMATILSAVGLKALSQDYGTRRLKDLVGARGSPALLRQVKKINNELGYKSNQADIFEVLEKQLNRFEPVRLNNLAK